MKKDIKNEYIFYLMKNKDPKGFELLYKHHFRKMYGIAFSIVKDEAKSHDVVQNVMIKLYKLSEDKFPTNYYLTWLYRVVKNEALMLLRKEKPTQDIDELYDVQLDKSSIDEYVNMDNYYHMIKDLNEKQKRVVTLKVLGGLTHKDISQTLDMPKGTVQWIYNTSIKKLRVSLASLASLIMVLSGALGIKLYNFFSYNEPIIEIDPEMLPPVAQQLGSDVYILSAVIIVLVMGLIIFYKKSDKIPTK